MRSPRRAIDAALHFVLWRPRLAAFGRGSRLYRPRLVTHPRRIFVGAHVRIRGGGRLEVVRNHDLEGRLVIDDHVLIEDFVHLGAADLVHIGANTVIGSMVTIIDHDHGVPAGLTSVLDEPLIVSPVTIGRGVWIGEKATILKGVTVGEGAIIGASALVTKDVPRGGIVGGVPARLLRTRSVD